MSQAVAIDLEWMHSIIYGKSPKSARAFAQKTVFCKLCQNVMLTLLCKPHKRRCVVEDKTISNCDMWSGCKKRAQDMGIRHSNLSPVGSRHSRQGILGERRNFVILTMLFFMLPPLSGPRGTRPVTPAALRLPLSLPSQQARGHRAAEDGGGQHRSVCRKLHRPAQRYQPHRRTRYTPGRSDP